MDNQQQMEQEMGVEVGTGHLQEEVGRMAVGFL